MVIISSLKPNLLSEPTRKTTVRNNSMTDSCVRCHIPNGASVVLVVAAIEIDDRLACLHLAVFVEAIGVVLVVEDKRVQ